MSDYKLKLKAFLHDPLDKQYVMWKLKRNHEEVAQEYFNYIFYEPIKDEKIEIADRLASAISRIIIAPKEDKPRERIEELKFEWSDIIYVNIFSPENQENAGKPENDDEIKNFLRRLGNLDFKDESERARLIFLFLWRFLPEIFPWINTHPADSRAPNHSIYDHLVQASAIASTLPKPAFLLFTIGPVQEFISTARKTSDLWAGSYILSCLTYKAVEVILKELGPDNVIYPNLLGQPLVDRWLYKQFQNKQIVKEFENENWFKKFVYNTSSSEKLTIANIPNRFLAIVPFDKAKEIAEECKKRVLMELESLTHRLLDSVNELEGTEISDSVKEKIKEHLRDYFQTYYVYLPWLDTDYTDVQTVLDEYKNLVGENEVYQVVKFLKEHPYYKPPNVGIAYSLLVELTEKFLASRKMFRKYEDIGDQIGEKCHLCGNYDILLINWSKLKREIVRKNERLCGVCFIKRLFPKIIKNILKLENEVRFPSTSEMATILYKLSIPEKIKQEFREKFNSFRKKVDIPQSVGVPALKNDVLFDIGGEWLFKESYKKEKLEREYVVKVEDKDYEEIVKLLREKEIKPPTYYAILMMDGDEMGRWLKGEKMPKIADVIHPKVKYALEGIENMENLLCSHYPISASVHQNFSRKLTYFALNKVRYIVEEKNYGKLIYAGGDDILAFLPVEKVLHCAYDLQREFREVLNGSASPAESTATMSAGIVIAHHKYPLGLALKKVREAESLAKGPYGRNAFCVYYLSRGGEERKFGGKWHVESFLLYVIGLIKCEKISKGFAYDILEAVEKLDRIELVELEVKRILGRKFKKNKLSNEEKKNCVDKFIEALKEYKNNLLDFGNMLVVIERIT